MRRSFVTCVVCDVGCRCGGREFLHTYHCGRRAGGGSCVHAVRVIVQCVLSSFGGGVIHPAALNTCSPGSVFTRDVPTKSYHAGE